ncbi:ubiE/COQ5 family methyltransferase domain protein [Mycobacterium xenopi 3993]|nr:ubiE/COQ5 family methyltransferase domain protein [Mycobacterium xenopi 3993]
MRALFEDAGFTITEQHRVHRPVWTKIVSDLLTVGIKS